MQMLVYIPLAPYGDSQTLIHLGCKLTAACSCPPVTIGLNSKALHKGMMWGWQLNHRERNIRAVLFQGNTHRAALSNDRICGKQRSGLIDRLKPNTATTFSQG